MVTGINENVEVLGRVFHVQTELTPDVDRKIRTVVFFGGRVVGSRARPLDRSVTDDEEIRELIRAHQAQIIDNFVSRAAALAAGHEDDAARSRPRTEIGPAPATGGALEPPDPNATAKLAESLAVRQLFNTFQHALPTASQPDTLEADLHTSSHLIRTLTSKPIFVDVRLDEQVAFYDFKTRIQALLDDGFDADAARALWTELARFSTYLSRINDRRELVAFDRSTFTWALAKIGGSGICPDEVLEHLQHTRGRSGELDCLLDEPEGIGVDQWMDIIMRLIDTTIGDEL